MKCFYITVIIVFVVTLTESRDVGKVSNRKFRNDFQVGTTNEHEKTPAGQDNGKEKPQQNEVFFKKTNIEKQETHRKEHIGKPHFHTKPEYNRIFGKEDNDIDDLEQQIENTFIQKPHIKGQEIIARPNKALQEALSKTSDLMSALRASKKTTTKAPSLLDTSFVGILKNISSHILNNVSGTSETFMENFTVKSETKLNMTFASKIKHILKTNPFLSGFFIAFDVILLLIIVLLMKYGVTYLKKSYFSPPTMSLFWKAGSHRVSSAEEKTSKGFYSATSPLHNLLRKEPQMQTKDPVSGEHSGIVRLSFPKSKEENMTEEGTEKQSRKDETMPKITEFDLTMKQAKIPRLKKISGDEEEEQPLIGQTKKSSKIKPTQREPSSFLKSFKKVFFFKKKSSKNVINEIDNKDELQSVVSEDANVQTSSENKRNVELLKTVVSSHVDLCATTDTVEDMERLRRKMLTSGERRIDKMVIEDDFRRSFYSLKGLKTAGGRPSYTMLDYDAGYREEIDEGRIKRARSFGTIHSESTESLFDEIE